MKQILFVILSVCWICCVSPVQAAASGEYHAAYHEPAIRETRIQKGSSVTLFESFELQAEIESFTSFRDQLPEEGKEVYDILSAPENLEKTRREEAVPVWISPDYNFTEENYEQVWTQYQAGMQTAERYSSAAVSAAMALNRDRSEIFWMGDFSREVHTYIKQEDGTLVAPEEDSDHYFSLESENTYVVCAEIIFDLREPWRSGKRSLPDDEQYIANTVEMIIQKEIDPNASRYGQLLAAHDWLTANNIYNEPAADDEDWEDDIPWVALSALDLEESPVCEGYARAFQLICDALDIPCVLITGTPTWSNIPHMWNYVQMENGAWYLVDVTWDDPLWDYDSDGLISTYERHNYFLIGNDNASKERRMTSQWVLSGNYDFQYPILNPSVYTYPRYTIRFGSDRTTRVETEQIPATQPDEINMIRRSDPTVILPPDSELRVLAALFQDGKMLCVMSGTISPQTGDFIFPRDLTTGWSIFFLNSSYVPICQKTSLP